MTAAAVHTSDPHNANRIWLSLGGKIVSVRRTGEVRYTHPLSYTHYGPTADG